MEQKPEELNTQLQKYQKEGCNLLMPSTEIAGLSEFHAPVIEKVHVSIKTEDGDIYPHDDAKEGPGKKYRLTKQALMRLSVCAGVIWSPTESKRIDNGADRNYIAYRAVGGIKKADGQPVFFSAEYDIDFEVLEEELRELYTKKAKNFQDRSDKEKVDYVEYCVKRDMLQKRKFRLRLSESGAMNRVLRMLLGIKQAYTTDELKKPFVMARIVFRPDFTDEKVKQQFIDASIKAMTGIYGPGAAAPVPEKMEPINITPLPSEKETEDGNGKESPQGPGQPPPSAPTREMLVTDFQAMTVEEKTKVIAAVAKAKNYKLGDYLAQTKKKEVKELKPETQMALYKHLLSLLNDESDIPF